MNLACLSESFITRYIHLLDLFWNLYYLLMKHQDLFLSNLIIFLLV